MGKTKKKSSPHGEWLLLFAQGCRTVPVSDEGCEVWLMMGRRWKDGKGSGPSLPAYKLPDAILQKLGAKLNPFGVAVLPKPWTLLRDIKQMECLRWRVPVEDPFLENGPTGQAIISIED